MKTGYVAEDAGLDAEEQWYEDNLEDFVSGDPKDRASLIKAAAEAPVILGEKKQMISIRLDQADLKVLKKKAERAGLGYQTMVSALLHQYAVGDLVNVEEARKLFRKAR